MFTTLFRLNENVTATNADWYWCVILVSQIPGVVLTLLHDFWNGEQLLVKVLRKYHFSSNLHGVAFLEILVYIKPCQSKQTYLAFIKSESSSRLQFFFKVILFVLMTWMSIMAFERCKCWTVFCYAELYWLFHAS